MRENIGLYRGKRIDNNKWVEGSLIKVTLDGKTVYLIFGDDFTFNGTDVKALNHALVDPETVGEDMGAHDKNGKEMFEDDIVRLYGEDLPSWYYKNPIAVVKRNGFGFEPLCEYDCSCDGFVRPTDCEVIGNIHDNPELLEAADGK